MKTALMVYIYIRQSACSRAGGGGDREKSRAQQRIPYFGAHRILVQIISNCEECPWFHSVRRFYDYLQEISICRERGPGLKGKMSNHPDLKMRAN